MQCWNCGYDRSGIPSANRCPECGAEWRDPDYSKWLPAGEMAPVAKGVLLVIGVLLLTCVGGGVLLVLADAMQPY